MYLEVGGGTVLFDYFLVASVYKFPSLQYTGTVGQQQLQNIFKDFICIQYNRKHGKDVSKSYMDWN